MAESRYRRCLTYACLNALEIDLTISAPIYQSSEWNKVQKLVPHIDYYL